MQYLPHILLDDMAKVFSLKLDTRQLQLMASVLDPIILLMNPVTSFLVLFRNQITYHLDLVSEILKHGFLFLPFYA